MVVPEVRGKKKIATTAQVTRSDVLFGRNGQIGPTALYLAKTANDHVKGPVGTEMIVLKRLAKTQLRSNIAIPALVKVHVRASDKNNTDKKLSLDGVGRVVRLLSHVRRWD